MGDDTRLLPDECARAYGQARSAPMHVVEDELLSPRHRAAAALHGWAEDAHHAPDDEHRLRLTRAEYEAALKAPGDCDQRGNPRPFRPALSPYAPAVCTSEPVGPGLAKAEATAGTSKPKSATSGKDGDK